MCIDQLTWQDWLGAMVPLSTLEYIHREHFEHIYKTKSKWSGLVTSVKPQKVSSEKEHVNLVKYHSLSFTDIFHSITFNQKSPKLCHMKLCFLTLFWFCRWTECFSVCAPLAPLGRGSQLLMKVMIHPLWSWHLGLCFRVFFFSTPFISTFFSPETNVFGQKTPPTQGHSERT